MTAILAERDALLAAVLDAPADDAPRLILADWLEEYGDEGDRARAEFIRVQCELARMKAPWCKTPARELNCEELGVSPLCDWCALRRRERELWPVVFRLFDIGIVPGSPMLLYDDEPSLLIRGDRLTMRVRPRRGFISSVCLPLAAWYGGGPCGRCNSRGYIGSSHSDYPGPHPELGPLPVECNACTGIGRTPGHGPALVRAHPLERVELSDREPYRTVAGRFGWDNVDDPGRPSTLPDPLWDRLPGKNRRSYPDREAAQGALSSASLAWARGAP